MSGSGPVAQNAAVRKVQAQKELCLLLEEVLVQIRGIASDAINGGHTSVLGRAAFDPDAACHAIYKIADAAHNLPKAISEPENTFFRELSLRNIANAGEPIFGKKDPFSGYVKQICHHGTSRHDVFEKREGRGR
ncbi:MAG: hypothetical protein ACYC9L_02910 [Sulfuricaulis sp.]